MPATPIMDWQNDVRGFWFSPKLSRDVRVVSQPRMRFRQLCRPEPGMGPHMGDTYKFTKISNLANGGQMIGEFDDVPVDSLSISYDELTVNEYTNSLEYTWYSSMFSELSVEHAWIMALMNDAVKTLDRAAAAAFRSADLVYTPTGSSSSKSFSLSTTGTAGATSTRNISAWDVKNIVDRMRATYNMPAYTGDDYLCVATSTFLRGLKDDSEWVEAAKYGDPERLFSGEVGRYYGVRFIEENNVMNGNLAGGLGEAVFIAYDPVIEIEIYPLEIQAKIAESYGRFRGLRWVNIVGWRKTWDFADEGEARLLLVYTA